ncbi:hypothetical protein C8J56DRAFT_776467, partial [Mycena floridula]
TLRRHMARFHRAEYRRWCKRNNFLSMLSEDSKARKTAADPNATPPPPPQEQSHVDTHFPVLTEKPVTYSDTLMEEAALEWLIETDQPICALEHPAFCRMMDIAAKATRGIALPNWKLTRERIISLFKKQMARLRDKFKVFQVLT